jgi:hypothetical protein
MTTVNDSFDPEEYSAHGSADHNLDKVDKTLPDKLYILDPNNEDNKKDYPELLGIPGQIVHAFQPNGEIVSFRMRGGIAPIYISFDQLIEYNPKIGSLNTNQIS